jgi:hypothetical protein
MPTGGDKCSLRTNPQPTHERPHGNQSHGAPLFHVAQLCAACRHNFLPADILNLSACDGYAVELQCGSAGRWLVAYPRWIHELVSAPDHFHFYHRGSLSSCRSSWRLPTLTCHRPCSSLPHERGCRDWLVNCGLRQHHLCLLARRSVQPLLHAAPSGG